MLYKIDNFIHEVLYGGELYIYFTKIIQDNSKIHNKDISSIKQRHD
jgi:hypothetical protein